MIGLGPLRIIAIMTGLAMLAATGNAVAGGNPRPAPISVLSGQGTVVNGIDLAGEVTLDQLVAIWGEPYPAGPTGEITAFYLPGGERLWLSFTSSEPRRLTRAIVADIPPSSSTRTLFNRLEITKRRRVGQIDFSRPVSAEVVVAAWGPPDSSGGSGLFRYGYMMANGTEVELIIQGDGLAMFGRPHRLPGTRH